MLIVLLNDRAFDRQRVRRSLRYAQRRAAGGERPQVQPLSHHRAVLADRGPRCSPAATITRSGWAAIYKLAASAPGYNSIRPKSTTPLAMTLKLNGYSTAQFGKCHEVPVWETSPAGPFDAWPTGGGGLSISTAFSAARRISVLHRSTRAPLAIEPDKTPERVITSSKT